MNMMNDIAIEDLSRHIEFIPLLAHWHFKQWGDMTGDLTKTEYEALLYRHVSTQELPMTLVAVGQSKLLGSTNVVHCDINIRSELTPWLAQLYVAPEARGRSIGSSLVQTAVVRSREHRFDYLYLYTSGTLPFFYERLGWTTREIVHYKGKDRTVMEIKLIG